MTETYEKLSRDSECRQDLSILSVFKDLKIGLWDFNNTVTKAQLKALNHESCYITKCYSLITENIFSITLLCLLARRRDQRK